MEYNILNHKINLHNQDQPLQLVQIEDHNKNVAQAEYWAKLSMALISTEMKPPSDRDRQAVYPIRIFH